MTQPHRALLIPRKGRFLSCLNIFATLIRGKTPTIRAAVSGKILSKVDRLFSNRLSDIFIELLQNARRAGATEVDVTLEEKSQGTRIFFTDNGEGISDFGVLLKLGDSEWDPETDQKEDPAGMGFFALVHSGVLVRSRGQEANIHKEGFLGREPIQLQKTEAGPALGTELTFMRPETVSQARDTLKQTVLFGDLTVRLDGEVVPREDFLKDALYVRTIDGVRIGVYRHWARVGWNFHGRVLEASCNRPELHNVMIDADGKRTNLYVRVDVREARHIHLKLPDRSAIVEDESYKAVYREARIAMYEYLASLPEHAADFSNFREAQALGVALKEASPWFASLYQHPSWEGDSEELFVRPRAVLASASEHVIVDLKDGTADFLGFTFLASVEYFHEALSWSALEDRPQYEGYSWYRAIPRIHSFRLRVDGKEIDENFTADSTLTLADSIQLSFVMERDGKKETLLWEIPFAGFEGGEGETEASLIVTRRSPWVAAEGDAPPFDLVDAAVYLAFSPGDGYESDSTETQLQDFRDDKQSEIIRTLGGTLAQLRHALDGALSDWKYNVTGFLREANIAELHLRRNERGQWVPEFHTADRSAE